MCYYYTQENSEEVEFTLHLHGLGLDASRDSKRQLAVRLLKDSQEKVSLDVRRLMDLGN